MSKDMLAILAQAFESAQSTGQAKALAESAHDPAMWQECYHTIAGRLECDERYPRTEAETLAYQSTLLAFIQSRYPAILGKFDAMIYPQAAGSNSGDGGHGNFA